MPESSNVASKQAQVPQRAMARGQMRGGGEGANGGTDKGRKRGKRESGVNSLKKRGKKEKKRHTYLAESEVPHPGLSGVNVAGQFHGRGGGQIVG